MLRLSDFKGVVLFYQKDDLGPTSVVRAAVLEQQHHKNFLYLRKIDGSHFVASVVFPASTVLVVGENPC
jgi:hypothetical protein